MSQETQFENKTHILSELWMSYRFDSEFSDFVDYNDLGLPLAFLISEELVKPSERARAMVDESFQLFLAALGKEDTGFDSLDDVMMA
jgi:hypothetical protein